MIKKRSVYFSEKNNTIVESLWNGEKSIQSENEDLKELVANTVDAAQEKHVPVVVRDGNRVTVKVGEAPHPMEAKHYILFVEVLAGNKVYRQDFEEGESVAEATFLIEEPNIKARAFCNLHGLWESPTVP